jgi:hypothetical protein
MVAIHLSSSSSFFRPIENKNKKALCLYLSLSVPSEHTRVWSPCVENAANYPKTCNNKTEFKKHRHTSDPMVAAPQRKRR